MPRITETIDAGSFSRIDVYESCARRAYFAFCQKIPEPDRGPPHKRCPKNMETGALEWHNDRGARVHDSADAFVRGINKKYCLELKDFDIELTNARAAYEEGLVYTEQMWCYLDDWTPTHDRDWNNTWMRIKLDIFQVVCDKKTGEPLGTRDEPLEACAIDIKTGKIFGNEVKHNEQVQLYALGAFKRYPSLNKVHTELWYVDHNDFKTITYSRKQALRYQAGWDRRMDRMTSDRTFKATPSQDACKYCPYRKPEDGGSGHCDKAYAFSQPVAPPRRTKGKATTRKKGSRSRA